MSSISSFRLATKSYAHSVPIASTVSSSDPNSGNRDCGIAFGSICDMNESRSAAALSNRWICSNDTIHVVATAFCVPSYRMLSQNSLLIKLTMSFSVPRSRPKYLAIDTWFLFK